MASILFLLIQHIDTVSVMHRVCRLEGYLDEWSSFGRRVWLSMEADVSE
jgi:hypothetical protein